MAYRDDIIALDADHLWRFDGDFNDSIGAINGTNTGLITTAAACCEDAANAVQTNATGDRVAFPTSPDIDDVLDRKAVFGWIRISSIQLPPKSLYREGNTDNQFNLVLWAGNNLMFETVNSGSVSQAFADQVLQPGRNYHIFARMLGTAFGDVVELYIDGVPQSISDVFGAASLADRPVAELGDPSGSTEVGNATVLLNACTNANHNFWGTFSGANAQLTDTQIREDLFEKGALPGVTITSGTQAAMQTQLDALADSVRPDEPLNIRIQAVTGDGDVSLTADNITHDALASIHVQYMGTGTLNWTNTNGADSSIGSTPNGGTINFINPATLTAAPLISGSEVRFYESGTANEIAGVENSGTSFSSLVGVPLVDVVVIKNDYQYVRVKGVDMTGGDVTVPISQVFDRQYGNP